MKRSMIVLLALGFALSLFASCKVVETPVGDDDDDNNDNDDNDNNDDDSSADADADSDGDSDVDSDADADSDGDVDNPGTCSQGAGYPCQCYAHDEPQCADATTCIAQDPSSEYGFCSRPCSGETDHATCTVSGWGVPTLPAVCAGDYDGNGTVDHCMIVCEYNDDTAPCPSGLVCNAQGPASVCM